MEEILASIRRIISEDEAGITPIKPVEPEAPAAKLPSVSVSAADIDALFSARVQEISALEPKVQAPPPVIEPVRPEPVRSEQPRIEPARSEVAPPPAAPALAEPRMLRASLPPIPEPRRATSPVEKPAPQRSVEDAAPAAPLVSAATDAVVSAAFGDLANTVLSNNARTIDDLVREMLRPMLKTWLDTNLPPLVERLVREEIERLSRRR
ncbi:DUF2497 domain-containing protein [Kaistia adipata]|uniref:DUF2497 domain-containing protein n=1 Tax=Kaistia adipata TaxID=166954 RepID=UPI0003FEC3F2|nr:DUF2497 domain-containing protein [Kaistia adipata]